MEFKPEKKLGFGLMRMPVLDPADKSTIDFEQVEKMVDLFLERGFTYFDTAWMYNNFASENSVRRLLTDRHPRESFTLATKIHCGFVNTPDDLESYFQAQLDKTGAGYFDYYLVHGVESGLLPKYEELDCFNWILEKKKQGLVRHAGFSFHDSAQLLDELLTKYPEMEFVQLQINYLDWESEWVQSRACYEVATKHGKPVVVMEPVKGGTLSNVPEEAEKLFKDYDPERSIPSWAIRFAASLPNVMVVLSGMSSLDQMDDNTGFMQDFVPLTEEEKELCFKAAKIINAQTAIPCTGCSYCTGGCPMNIAIPQYFSLYNEDMREDLKNKGWTSTNGTFKSLTRQFGAPSDCVSCGQCEAVCPQHISIIDNLMLVGIHFSIPMA